MSKQDGTKEISYSRVKVWRRCPREHYLKYVEKWESKVPASALITGKTVHEMIETFLDGKDWEKVLDKYTEEYDKLLDEQKEKEKVPEPDELRRLMVGYVRTWSGDGLKYPMIEHQFKVPLFDDTELEYYRKTYKDDFPVINFNGVIDAIAMDSKGAPWIVEHKTHKRIPDEDVRMMNLQVSLYSWAVKRGNIIDGVEPQGILWDYIRTKPPVVPEVLKDGTMTKRKNIDTDLYTYMAQLDKLGCNKNDYIEIIDRLEKTPNNFYRRVFFPHPSRHLVSNVLEDFKQSAVEIVLDGENNKLRNLSPFTCKGCTYKDVCYADLFGLDVGFVLKTKFKKREKKEEVIQEVPEYDS